MRIAMTVFGVLAVIVVFAMILRTPDAKVNLKKEHRKSLVMVFIPMVAFLVLVAILLSHVGV